MSTAKPTTRTVLSIRVSDTELQAISAVASRAGMTVSEFARETLRRAVTPQWSVNVFDARSGFAITRPSPTGGQYSRLLASA